MRLKLIITICLLISSSSVSFADSSKNDAQLKFQKAEQEYKSSKYAASINSYQSILDEGLESSEIYYNMGNAYFKLGKIGKAVLYYEKAKKLKPRDGDLKYNLKYATSFVNSPNVVKNQSIITKLMDEHVKFYSIDEMVLIMALIVILISLVELAKHKFFIPKKIVIIANSLLIFIFIIFLFGFMIKRSYYTKQAVVIEESSSTYEPREEATEHYKVYEAQKVIIIKEDEAYYKIKRDDGKQGWVQKANLERI